MRAPCLPTISGAPPWRAPFWGAPRLSLSKPLYGIVGYLLLVPILEHCPPPSRQILHMGCFEDAEVIPRTVPDAEVGRMSPPGLNRFPLCALVGRHIQRWIVSQHQPHRPGIGMPRQVERAQRGPEDPCRPAHRVGCR